MRGCLCAVRMRSEVRMRSNESCVERSKTFWMHFLNNGRFIVCVGRIRSQEKGHSYHEQCVLLYYFYYLVQVVAVTHFLSQP